MKRIIALILIAVMYVGILCGCGSNTPAEVPTETPAEEAAPVPAETEVPAAESEPEPAKEAESEPTAEPAAKPAVQPDRNSLYDTLTDLQTNWHPGVAGSSLQLIRFAGYIMDQYMDHGEEYLLSGALAYDLGETDEYGDRFADKLSNVYSSALCLFGHFGQENLGSAGYYPARWGYTGADVHKAFSAIFEGCGLEMPTMIRLYRSDDQATYFFTFGVQVEELSAETLSRLFDEQIFHNAGVAFNSIEKKEETVYADINSAYAAQIGTMGTSGEYMLIGSLVNTLLDAYAAENVIITVNGAPLETGHAIYDAPLTYYTDNEGA